VDVTLETLKTPLKVIESVVMAAINLLGAVFCCEYETVKLSLFYVRETFKNLTDLPVAAVMAPVLFVYQIAITLWDPKRANSINFSYVGYDASYKLRTYSH
jgi:hypothetical protein